MNIHLDEAYDLASQIDAILHVIDEAYMEDAESRLQNLHHTLRDLTARLIDELDLLAADRRVVDAIYAANDVRRLCTLTTEN